MCFGCVTRTWFHKFERGINFQRIRGYLIVTNRSKREAFPKERAREREKERERKKEREKERRESERENRER